MKRTATQTISYLALLAAAGSAMPAWGQSAGNAQVEEVVVTARKRDETSISVPVAIAAFTHADLERYSTSTFQDLVTFAPGLKVSTDTGLSGGSIFLRGVGTIGGTNPTFDQSVAVNVDGVALSRGNILRLGQFDMQQIEILKGPQALFFGKNSPAGVISISTADPTSNFDVTSKSSYEFSARQKVQEVVLSGPLTDKLGARLAFHYEDQEGAFRNVMTAADAANINAILAGLGKPPAAFAPANDRGPQLTQYFVRGTLKYEPNDRLTLRAKFTYSDAKSDTTTKGYKPRWLCPYGAPQTAAIATALAGAPNPALAAAIAAPVDCGLNDTFSMSDLNPASIALHPGLLNDDSDTGYRRDTLALASVDAKYDLTEALQFNSVTSYARIYEYRYDSTVFLPVDLASLNFGGPFKYREWSEEARLSTNYTDSPINGLIGVYFQDSPTSAFTQDYAQSVPGTGAPIPIFRYSIGSKTYSAFGQARWKLTDTLELSGGVRWTKDDKSLLLTYNGLPQPVAPSSLSSTNWSPEVTLSYRPTQDLTAYAAYKQGFKSGGFGATLLTSLAASAPIPASSPRNESFLPEAVKGEEIGLKMALLDHTLRANIAAYHYIYSNLQVNSINNSTGVPIIYIQNAASAKAEGVEGDFIWKPPVDGLTLHGAINYSHARFTSFPLATCYIGQTIAQGCRAGIKNAAGAFAAQDLSGTPFPNSSDWVGALGFDYERALTSSIKFGVTGDVNYQSPYNPSPDYNPIDKQPETWLFNASVRLSDEQRGWELALIGQNLGDTYRALVGNGAPLSGNSAFTGTNNTGGLADQVGNVTVGRTVRIQLTLHPTSWW